jgi:hypothetical protein
MFYTPLINLVTIVADTTCKPMGGSLLGFPKWYKYLDGIETSTKSLNINGTSDNVTSCVPKITSAADFWLIGAAIIEILLRVAVLSAVGIIIWGSIKYIVSQGEPDKVSAAKNTITDGIVGLVIAIVATAVITFVAGRFS